MSDIGIYFGTDTGTTRLIAKKLAKKLDAIVTGKTAAKPLNVNRTGVEQFMAHDSLILGTPTYGINQLPGKSTNIAEGSWEEFLPLLEGQDFSGKVVALYGLGDQEKYSGRFVDSMIHLYRFFSERGAGIVGQTDTDGYSFEFSMAVVEGRFVGLVLDQQTQPLLSEERMDRWLADIGPQL
ncbi:MAG: flavodoxin [Zetaproteobacteria bacterium CG06_land_8_20_14_3_00_59_53]|nr:MAG: flavodoxin [Zetaproteobacteria bacterium CG2_30_59_37]PIO90537.1 MAG: flavodoxin [Zetaproteobacteria bacterium CG23_combo_of_CG06-09_8_20_14_all_59_86]PIQ66006.1 MAG: flavodoxin [Zetaproteobacteria bacterium CG11_big_fil_rev_8_21_14_0_20_59_439]PIU71486.1 MAG: flavodoxin [Zetaproteobacteria bacterium CG06_land_8_20_14_3_00_59_53]PIU97744.1 MAG: flavodoxin [Zetaproteobacteria bacterium CG03_land_8_20_14_0_80_59_51]PIY47313.1 MAG: flavodoxin [Zetaproteobacteria bacterium CG_4_10_14_0_8_u